MELSRKPLALANWKMSMTVRIIYGGSVSPEHVAGLLASLDVDGLGATRRGRNAVTFAAIVRQIIQAKVS